jgi:hypothetical protein
MWTTGIPTTARNVDNRNPAKQVGMWITGIPTTDRNVNNRNLDNRQVHGQQES